MTLEAHSTESAAENADSVLAALAVDLGGRVVLPADAGWDAARAPWNISVDQKPAAVATPLDIRDIQRILVAAREAGLGVTVQPRGHGANGDAAGCILVRMSAFDEISVDTDARTARIGAGVLWGTFLPHLDGTGLIPLAGTSPDVSVIGYLLSGGHSWFSRWKGLAAHSIRAVELVDAQGDVRRITAESDAELFWALRGGGGLFGVVTAVEIELFEAPALFGGKILFPDAVAETVFAQVTDLMTDAPAELSIFFGMINFPDAPFIPEPMRGQTFANVDVVFVGTAESAAPLLAPLLASAPVIADQTRPFTISELGQVAAEPEEPIAALDLGASIVDLQGDAVAALVGAFRAATPDGLTMMQLRRLGGAVSDTAAGDSAVVGNLDSAYLLFAAAILMGPLPRDRSLFSPLESALEGRTVPRSVVSLLTSGQTLAYAYPAETLRRLAAVKAMVDPGNVIRSNRPLP
ncbi:FAD-binding oxidoreductase [Glaciibacter superstes]|uniref:FAD-binding oxidoreductase n=1 Tax=Glaciibacter superstes TaxID=501023 RepID=UPI0003B38288|nr:FAD-dependent oxidoreductase [Glaciibacter superstes]